MVEHARQVRLNGTSFFGQPGSDLQVLVSGKAEEILGKLEVVADVLQRVVEVESFLVGEGMDGHNDVSPRGEDLLPWRRATDQQPPFLRMQDTQPKVRSGDKAELSQESTTTSSIPSATRKTWRRADHDRNQCVHGPGRPFWTAGAL
jgi:hypothetical protein